MKKSLIALAIVGTFAAPAFAATEVYGQARLSIDDNNIAGSKLTMNDRVSRVGIKGSEDLGGGMTAIYGMEWGVNLNSNSGEAGTCSLTAVALATGTITAPSCSSTSPFGGRNAFIGLKGAFGTVLGGKHDTPYKLAGSADVFGDTAADSQDGAGIIGRGNFDLRATNALAYISPDWSGFHFAAAVTNNGSAESLTEAQSLALVYKNGPLSLTAGYEAHGAVTAGDESAWKVTGKYQIGDLGLAATYEAKDVANVDLNAYLVSATYGLGPITLALQHGKVDTTAATDLTRTTVGAIYNLSKKTSAYLAFNKDDDGTANKSPTNANAYTLGLNHSF